MKPFNSSVRAALSWILAATLAIAQTPVPAAPLRPSQAFNPANDQPILRVTTGLIQIIVVAQDRHGNPVTDLTTGYQSVPFCGARRSLRCTGVDGHHQSPPSGIDHGFTARAVACKPIEQSQFDGNG